MVRIIWFLFPFILIGAYSLQFVLRFPITDEMPAIRPLEHHPIMVGPGAPIEVELEIELSDPRELEALFHEALDTIARKHEIKSRMLTVPPSL